MNANPLILPDISTLKKRAKAMAMLDAIIEPEWQFRYYSFRANFDKGCEVSSMRDGSGNAFSLAFYKCGAIIKGFDHERVNNVEIKLGPLFKNILDGVPKCFGRFVNESAFSVKDETSFIYWRETSDSAWRTTKILASVEPDVDGRVDLIPLLCGGPLEYKKWADKYYEKIIPLEIVEKIYSQSSVTNELIKKLNPDISLKDLKNDIEEIGW